MLVTHKTARGGSCKGVGQWGVYALDIWYIYHIALSNKAHMGAKTCSLEVTARRRIASSLFSSTTRPPAIYREELTLLMARAQSDANQAFSYPDLRISTDGIEDIVNLICKRYAADFEFTLGSLRLSVTPAKEVLVRRVPEPNIWGYYRVVVRGKLA